MPPFCKKSHSDKKYRQAGCMKFLVDAQLPKKLARWFSARGYDAIHTLDLPEKNKTSDEQINELSLRERRIVISKDSDFYDMYFQKLEPHKLIYLTVGNMSTDELIQVFDRNLDRILIEIEYNNVLEITQSSIITLD